MLTLEWGVVSRSSPSLKNPKKAVQHTAHINVDSYSFSLGAHNALSCLRVDGVIRRLSLLVQVSAPCLLIPFSTSLSFDIWAILGPSKLLAIACAGLQIIIMLHGINCTCDISKHSRCCDTGKGFAILSKNKTD